MKVYGLKMNGSMIWFDNKTERDVCLADECRMIMKEYPDDQKPVACEGRMLKKDFNDLREFEGW